MWGGTYFVVHLDLPLHFTDSETGTSLVPLHELKQLESWGKNSDPLPGIMLCAMSSLWNELITALCGH